MSRDSDLRLYVELNNVNKFTYNLKSQSRDITRPHPLYPNVYYYRMYSKSN